MAISSSIGTVFLIASHIGAADHFATFSESLASDGYKVQVYASGPALKKFQDRKIQAIPFSLEKLSPKEEMDLAEQLARSSSKASAVFTDVGHAFNCYLHKALSKHASKVLRIAYYDNPEPYVPGGYSSIAAEVMLLAQKVMFANANLATTSIFHEPNKEVSLPYINRIGLGYYPIAQANKIALRREKEYGLMRKQLFAKYDLEEKGQKVCVYFGGNNEEYFSKAFPAFLNILASGLNRSNLSNLIILMQQHPAAKGKNRDGQLIEAWIKQFGEEKSAPKIIMSEWTTDDVQIVADVAMYYQTSMGPQFVLAGISVLQIAHETYEDILIRSQLCPAVANDFELIKSLSTLEKIPQNQEQKVMIYKSLGIKSNWFQIFKQAIVHTKTPRYFLGGVPLINYFALRYYKSNEK